MGFFSNIFKRKEGGTFVGNLLRSTSSAMTGGVLGSGQGLQKWEQEQALARLEAEEKRLMQITAGEQLSKGQLGTQVGNQIADGLITYASNGQGQTSPTMGESIVLATLKKHWYWFLAVAVALVVGIWYLMSKKNNKFKRLK